MKKTTSRRGVITLQVEVRKPLSRKKLIQVELSWDDMLDLPISGDDLLVDRFGLKVIRGPRADDMLLDQPSAALNPEEGLTYWYCHYDGEWARAEMLAAEFMKDRRVLSAQILP